MTFCCTRFAQRVVIKHEISYGRKPKVIEQEKDGTWNVNGCCGGGCWVLEKIVYCPYCATKLNDDPLSTL